MDLLTAAGLIGRATSVSGMLGAPMRLDYRGHAFRNGVKLGMRDFARKPQKSWGYHVPTILVIGTSMSAGKTTSAKVIVRQLKACGAPCGRCESNRGRPLPRHPRHAGRGGGCGLRLCRCRSSFLGRPDRDQYRERLEDLLGLIVEQEPDVVIAEAGASPLEPYNGDTALEHMRDSVVLTVLCASDPYSVVGVMRGYDMMKPDVVAGVATSTSAGVEVVEKLTKTRALNLLDPNEIPSLRAVLDTALDRK